MPAHYADPDDRLPDIIHAFAEDRAAGLRKATPTSFRERLAEIQAATVLARNDLDTLDFSGLTRSDQIDTILLDRFFERDERRLREEGTLYEELGDWLPIQAHCALGASTPEHCAEGLDSATERARAAIRAIESLEPAQALRFLAPVEGMRRELARQYTFRNGYDPLFTWWCEKPYAAADTALSETIAALKKRSGADDPEALVGIPVGRDAVIAGLREQGIAYSPEELLAIGERERQWCLDELRAAARELGHGDDWKVALEVVKNDHVAPGEQPALVRELAQEAIAYVHDNALLTLPESAVRQWRMEMMSPERQKVNPFFLGGESIIVSFPTNTMEHSQKRMSLRGNNRHFARATVHHELIPGHHLQQYFERRFRPYRRLFTTPFWIEGWTLHWEMLLWERGFATSPQQRIGMLFWRLHRAVRVVFSLGYQLGERSAAECVEMLVEGVGHERDNAIAEVRRSIGGSYDPLYQLAYLIGGLQVHALHKEKTAAGWTDRRFHDEFLRQNQMPIELLRLLWSDESIPPDWQPTWRFAD